MRSDPRAASRRWGASAAVGTAEARNLRPGLRVLLTSGYADAATLDGARDDALPLLGKPYRREVLAAAVRRILDAA